ncbi:hypothetical protein LO771_19815 [Streptacidiphilus sp. ASG 303]|uniref:hypothetical protein n=1 Tax=Streptacidiphilus sp. ASG 303 TaxID=2896847 RepID=UPI001E40D017|nr:hypothetical protein [Streptacidiphilus sp. ASG 303]MCD0484580.1 hypothetical protein [Streptacidiphilus sp. ASG 303]
MKTGVRPDLLYDLAAGPLAGEARGRRRDAKQMLPAVKGTADQRERLEKLAAWSVGHGDHDYFMSWVWLGAGGVYVDIFLPKDSPATVSLKTGWIKKPGSRQPWRFRLPRPDPRRRVEVNPEGDLDQPFLLNEPGADAPDGMADEEVLSADRARQVVNAAMDRAFGREGRTLGELGGVPVRGTWLRADAIGPARHEVLVGVLGERVPVDLRAQRRRLEAGPGHRLDLFLEGRLLTLVHPVGEPRPSWGRIAEEAVG